VNRDAKDRGVRTTSGAGKIVAPAQLSEFIQRSLTAGKGSLALLMIDLGRSDRLDAMAADATARERTQHILSSLGDLVRPDDRLAAVTEDRFWMVLPQLAHEQVAVLAVARILDALDRLARGALVLQPSIGVAIHPGHGDTLGQLLVAADAAMRAARRREERYAVYQPAHAGPVFDPRFLAEMKAALRAGEITLNYQPQVDLRSRGFHSAEALVRWQRSDGSQVSPARIAEAAEHGEILHGFMQFLLNTALRHMVAFGQGGQRARFSVNVSAMLVTDRELPAIVAQFIETWGVAPRDLTLEMTERAIVSDTERCAEVLNGLKRLGVRLAMDDFGTGYSSLAHLKLFPFDELKIDKLFVRNMLENAGDLRIVRAMIDLGHNFDMRVVAEGVEDVPTLDRLRELGCDIAQGYAIARPMDVAALGEWWRANTGAAA